MFQSLAVVGATGAVGRIIRQLLEERNFPIEDIRFLASARSAGTTLPFRGKEVTVQELRPEAFDDIDLCIASTPDDIAADFIPEATKRGTVVVDESGAWRMNEKVALVVPEVNAHALENHDGIIASPNCSTTQMVVAMKPLHDFSPIKRVVVSTYQATSGAGVSRRARAERTGERGCCPEEASGDSRGSPRGLGSVYDAFARSRFRSRVLVEGRVPVTGQRVQDKAPGDAINADMDVAGQQRGVIDTLLFHVGEPFP